MTSKAHHDASFWFSGTRIIGNTAMALLAMGLLNACAAQEVPGREEATVSQPASSAVASESSSSMEESPGAEASEGTDADEVLEGVVIAVDPGHNGANGSHPQEINAPVDDGRGGTKPCNTTGTSTANGYSEAAFNFDVAQRLETLLTDSGATVVMSREDNDGVGPCVDERGEFAEENDADFLISIHANGTENPSVQGFHVIVADPAISQELGELSQQLARNVSEAFVEAGYAQNPAFGGSGLSLRSDIAGLNNAQVPAVLIEAGEMRNPNEAAQMESAEGRQNYADAMYQAVIDYVAEGAE